MILTDAEMEQVRQCIEGQAGLDGELVQRCGHMIRLGAFDEAVRSAFVLLEERLRRAMNEDGKTGTQLAQVAFNPQKGPIAKHLGQTLSEREGLRELYSGAFKLFRNPSAHGVVGYDAAEGKAIVGLVNLLLLILQRAPELPPPGLLPDNVQAVLARFEGTMGAAATSRLRAFLARCVSEAGLEPNPRAKDSIGFKRRARRKLDHQTVPTSALVPVFYLSASASRPALHLPTGDYYTPVVGFESDWVVDAATSLGMRPRGKYRNPTLNLRLQSDQRLFDDLFDLVKRISDEWDAGLAKA